MLSSCTDRLGSAGNPKPEPLHLASSKTEEESTKTSGGVATQTRHSTVHRSLRTESDQTLRNDRSRTRTSFRRREVGTGAPSCFDLVVLVWRAAALGTEPLSGV